MKTTTTNTKLSLRKNVASTKQIRFRRQSIVKQMPHEHRNLQRDILPP